MSMNPPFPNTIISLLLVEIYIYPLYIIIIIIIYIYIYPYPSLIHVMRINPHVLVYYI